MGRRILLTSFGWNDPGGGTTVPRLVAKELARRGWDVTVFHAAVPPAPGQPAYHVGEWEEDGVRLLGVFNRRHGLWDREHPLRELDDPPITAAYAAALDRLAPEVVHFHNLHNLGGALIDATAARGIPSFFSTHNYWLLCARAYLMAGDGTVCAGPGDGRRCATCVGRRHAADDHARRLAELRARFSRGVTRCLAVSEAVRRTLVAAGYPAEMIEVVRQAMPHDMQVWKRLGRDRRLGRAGGPDAPLTVAFLGSAYPHKGPQLLVEAAQRVDAPLRVEIHGEVPEAFAAQLRARDRRGVVTVRGAFATDQLVDVLASADVVALPSLWWDCAPLVAAECLAARVPLVVPRLGGLAEAVRDGVDGPVVDPLSADALAGALSRLAREQGLLERLQAGITAPRAFSAYVDELEAHYLGRAPQPPPAVEEPAVWWHGPDDAGLATALAGGGHVQRAGTRDPLLPHPADVEVRAGVEPGATRPASSGRLVVLPPADAAPAALPAHVDELWAGSEAERTAWVAAGNEKARVRAVAADPAPVASGGDAATGAAASSVVARVRALAAQVPRASDPTLVEPWPLPEQVALRVLATPAWRAPAARPDRLGELLAAWCAATSPATSACLYLLADPAVDGTPEEIERRILAALPPGADLDAAADVSVLLEPASAERDARLHRAVAVYVPLHPACAGHERLARSMGSEIIAPGALPARLAAVPAAAHA